MSQGLQALRLLVVDDNPHIRAIVLELAHGLGVREVLQAADGAEGLMRLREAPVDVALVDLNMAPVDGVAFTREVRNAPDSPDIHLPVIMMTGHAERAKVEAARDAGVTEFLLKPLTLRAVADRLEAVIQRPRAFVRAPHYFGPDRRRRADPAYAGPRRRVDDLGAGVAEAADAVIEI